MKRTQKPTAESLHMKSGEFDALMRKALGVQHLPSGANPKSHKRPAQTRQKAARKTQ